MDACTLSPMRSDAVGGALTTIRWSAISMHDERVDESVLELVGEFGGSISAEHGVGVAKRRWLHLTRSPDEIDVMAAVKHALDPHGILNPGVLLPERGDERALVSIGGGMTWQGP
jgi:FAD/FMN-containing dehydrogenase